MPMGKWVQDPENQKTDVAQADRPGSGMETIPSSATCNFVGEGAANVVFELTGVQDHPKLKGQLLRLPKDEWSANSYAELQHYWENKVSPLFEPQELVQQRLVELPQDRAFFDRLNQQLHQIEQKGTRRHDFAGHRISAQGIRTGMLVEDMRPGPSSSENDREGHDDDLFTLHEIKPKWLHQSPRAPEGAEQCRNCAREVQRNIKNQTRKPIFCPLNLVKATDFPRNQNVAGDIRRSLGLSAAQSDNLQAWLRGSTLLRRLRAAQWENDHAPVAVSAPGVEADSDTIARYCLAMTLRDCSLFLRIPCRPGCAPGDVVAKLADMDMKNFDAKREYWEGMEQGLHDRGLYWKADEVSAALTDCQLPFYKASSRSLPPELRKYYRL